MITYRQWQDWTDKGQFETYKDMVIERNYWKLRAEKAEAELARLRGKPLVEVEEDT